MNYEDFVASKLAMTPPTGLATVPELHPSLFPHQRDLVAWALRRGRAALFADTGLGKSACQLEWARHVTAHTGKPTLILAPLAVTAQTVREGERIDLPVTLCREDADVRDGVNITNYERLHRFDTARFGAVVLDESSCIKHHDAKTLRVLLDAFRETPFKLCATATPSPNDYTELGTHAEFLGLCSRVEMLSEYFVHDGGETQTWRLKGHARSQFWRWIATWGALVRKPSDLGHDDTGYDLPPLVTKQHVLPADPETVRAAGLLFAAPAGDLAERRNARRASLAARVAECVALVTECTCEQSSRNASTSANTTNARSTRGSRRHKSSEPSTTQTGVQNTLPTANSESNAERRPRSGTQVTHGNDSCNEQGNTASAPTTTTQCSSDRAEDAPSAERRNQKDGLDTDFTSTTATKLGACEDCSAESATADSAISKTESTSSKTPSSTCAAHERWIIWVDLNAEQEAIAKALGDDCYSISGSQDIDEKERMLTSFIDGERRILLTKPSIAGFGINLQSVARMAFVGVTDSYEAFYQAVRRIYRFGQLRECQVHIFASEIEGSVVANLERKARDAEKMANELSVETREALRAEIHGTVRKTNTYAPGIVKIPMWLKAEAS